MEHTLTTTRLTSLALETLLIGCYPHGGSTGTRTQRACVERLATAGLVRVTWRGTERGDLALCAYRTTAKGRRVTRTSEARELIYRQPGRFASLAKGAR